MIISIHQMEQFSVQGICDCKFCFTASCEIFPSTDSERLFTKIELASEAHSVKRRGKYPSLVTDTEMNCSFSIY